ncbi:FAD-linked oxidase [Candidatus Falkowbacteria bacterium RIFOXYB2_FULL_34_18]|uniref:Delta(24)-sterol reductase n=1 Tax=Candidatus Falkowbacteria bacterium RIFOXYD2_FULL_34_120 TaxID=1798007 RepID=A0A1F5TQV6_9BACT|nr:MAG: FAD-linked oxidase [Candidatus Falkowbacteria bacterium RIFOXYB2_FULL_34_18]OGF29426.1 MAG: FAD-linked oxidase [Candidatus Falkowbacteria bacterium RIFOXYC12_FULL_34_55]OGF36739.1 MAG: FAD-linked oxidase [Candidatus Falkowbacteria bacterium RIFOXYC2_FULL_34_220]OGF38952.1 MAG: FAD-linked oxidase [Candidatus Falkowbacteria bacterium RIFOXYD12_FULL_34_57]OGF41144.1 MAG: FAD-linked oxidase [Candidatus Falkowbacteria bacterium RIFOXYD2_FULL_34_120]
MLTHKEKINRIIQQLKEHNINKPASLKKKTVSHEVPKPGDKRYYDQKIDVSDLTAILYINPDKRICEAESGVTFIDLVKETMKHNLVPIIVPELKTITIGGAVAGCSLESMSYKYGGFHDTCLEYEIITANGEVLVCTPNNKNSLLFQMIHGTFGTLGIISKLKFKLVPAEKFVKVVYEKYQTLEDYKKAVWKHFQKQDVDFMDGIIHSHTEYVLSVANFINKAPYNHNYDWMRVYYKSTKTRKEDYLKTIDYFFRYDKGVTNVTPKSFLGRLFFGKFIDSARVLSLVNKFQKIISAKKIPITVDTFIPFSRITDFMEWYKKEINFFPLWCVPYKLVRQYEWLDKNFREKIKDELFLDIAIYGMKKKDRKNYYKLIEDKLIEIGAIKTLISTNYYKEEDFWKIWNKDYYDKLKKQTDPNNIFRNLYTKTCKTMRGVEE